jgi:hypothetical protein
LVVVKARRLCVTPGPSVAQSFLRRYPFLAINVTCRSATLDAPRDMRIIVCFHPMNELCSYRLWSMYKVFTRFSALLNETLAGQVEIRSCRHAWDVVRDAEALLGLPRRRPRMEGRGHNHGDEPQLDEP